MRARSDARGAGPDLRQWFELYLARQVVIAEALAQGYGERPEVLRSVDAMERHMLAQLDGEAGPPSEVELLAAYDRDFGSKDGAKPSFAEIRGVLEQSLLQERRQAWEQKRRVDVSQRAELTIVPAVAEQLMQRLKSAVSPNVTVADETVGSLAPAIIAVYRLDDARVELPVAAWQRRFNEQFVRVLPADLAQLTMNIQELVAREYSWHNARRRGLDREPQFVEDRRNFLYYQALDLFEQEKLVPQIEITSGETESYYRNHAAEFIEPLRARGRLLHFRELADARRWLQTRDETAVHLAEDIVVSRQSPIAGGERVIERILRIPDHTPFGPLRTDSGPVIFFKQATENGPRIYSEVTAAIRSILTREKLQALELRLARKLAPKYAVQDTLNPNDFGIFGAVEKPWQQRD